MTTRLAAVALSLLFIYSSSSPSFGQSTDTTTARNQITQAIGGLSVFAGQTVSDVTAVDKGFEVKFSTSPTAMLAFPSTATPGTFNFAVAIDTTTLGIRSTAPGGDMLNGVTLPRAVFILSQNANQIATANLPSALLTALRAAAPGGLPNSIQLQSGVNGYLEADASGSSLGSFMRTQLGLKERTFSLTGKLPNAVFAQQLKRPAGANQTPPIAAANIAGEFDLSGTLGKLVLQGVSPQFLHMPAQSQFKLAADQSGLTASINSQIEIIISGDSFKYDLDIKAQSAGGQVNGALTGTLEAAQLLAFGGVSVSGLAVTAESVAQGWDLKFNGQARIGNDTVPAEITYTHAGFSDANFQARVTSGINLGDLIPNSTQIPVLSTMQVQSAIFRKDSVEAVLSAQNHTYALAVHPDGANGTVAIIEADQLNLGQAIPGAETTFLKDLAILDPVLILETGTAARDISFAGLPPKILTALQKYATNSIKVKPGLNVFATFDPTKSAAASALQQIGLNRPVPLTGSFDPQILSDLLSHATGNSTRVSNRSTVGGTLPTIDLTVPLPQLTIPGTPQGGLFKSPALEIKRGTGATTTASANQIKVAISSDFDITIANSRLSFPGELNLTSNTSGQLPDLDFNGEMATGWSAAFGLNWLQISSLKVALASKAAATGSGRDFAFAMNGTTSFGQSTNIGIDATMTVESNRVTGAEFKIANSIALGDLPPFGHLAALNKISLGNLDIKIGGTGNDRELSLAGEIGTADIFSYPGLGLDGGSFTATEKGTGWDVSVVGKGKLNNKDIEIDAKLDTTQKQTDYAVAVKGDIKLSDIAGSVASALDSLTIQEILITADLFDAKVVVGNEPLDIAMFKLANQPGRYLSLTAGEFDLAKAVPGVGSLFQGASVKDASIILAKKGSALTGVAAASLPEALGTAVTEVAGGTIDIEEGVTLLAQLDISAAASAKQAFDTLTVPSSIPIKGTIDPTMLISAFRAGAGATTSVRSALASLDLQAPLGTLTIPGLPSGAGFMDTVFHISGTAPDRVRAGTTAPQTGVFVTFATDFVYPDGNTQIKTPGSFAFSRTGGTTNVAFNGELNGGWAAPFGVSWLHLGDLKLDASVAGSSGNREVKLDFTGATDIGSAKGLKIAVAIDAKSGGSSEAAMTFDGALKLSDLPPLASMPRADGFELDSLAIAATRQGSTTDFKISTQVKTAGLVDFPGFSVIGGKLDAEKNADAWTLNIEGDGKINNKDVKITAALAKETAGTKPDYTVTITDVLSVSELLGAGSSIPGLNNFKITEIRLTRSEVEAKMTYKTDEVDVLFYHPDPKGKAFVALTLSDFNLGEHIPGGGGTVLKDVTFGDIALLVVPEGGAATNVSVDSLPEIVSASIKAVAGTTVDLKRGANMFAEFQPTSGTGLADVFSSLGITQGVPLKGSVDPRMLARGATTGGTPPAASASWISSLDISAELPNITIPGAPSNVSFAEPSFSIKGADGLAVKIATTFNMTTGSSKVALAGEFDFTSHDGAKAIEFKAATKTGWAAPFDISWIHLSDLNLDLALQSAAGQSGGNRQMKLDFNAVTDLGAAKDLKIAIAIDAASGGTSDASFNFDGALKLSDIPPLAAMPRADGFELDKLALAVTQAAGKTNFKISTAVKTAGLVDFPGFSITGGTLDADKANDAWALNITADAKLHDKDVKVTAALAKEAAGTKPDYTVTITDDLNVSELLGAGNSIPGLNEFSIKEIKLTRSEVEAKMTVKTEEVDVLFYHPNPKGKAFVALALSNFTLGDAIPGGSETVLKDITFADLALVVVPEDGAKTAVSVDSLPAIVSAKIKAVAGTTVNLKNGLNLYSNFEPTSGTELAEAFSSLGLGSAIPLKGSVDPQMLASSAGTAANDASSAASNWVKTLDLSATLPTLTIPGIPSDVSFTTPMLEISAVNGTKVAVSTTLNAKIGSSNLSLPGEFDFTSHGKEKDIEFKGGSTSAWAAPLDIPWIHVSNLGVDFSLKSGTGASGSNREIDLALSGQTEFGKHKNLPVKVAFKIDNGKLVDGEIQVASEVDLSEIPVLKGIPNASKFGIKNLAISTAGIGATAILEGKDYNAGLIHAKGADGTEGWTMIVERDTKNLGDLIPFDKTGLLKKMPLSHALIGLSEHGLVMNSSALPDFAQPLLKPIFDIHPAQFNLDSGLIVAAVFEPGSTADSKKAFGKLGLGSGTFLLGEVGGLFGGTPSVKIEAFLPSFGKPTGLPKFMAWPDSITPAFFVQLTEEAVEVGIEVDMNVKAGDNEITLATKLEMELTEGDVSFDIEGEMDGIWDSPFGIKGLKLENVALKAGISVDGSVKLGFKGTTVIGPETISMAADIEPDPELLGIPKSIAFQGSITSLGALEIVELVEAIAGEKSKTSEAQIPFFELHNVTLAFATPGAEDPDLGIVSAGFAAKGSLAFMSYDLGGAQFSISETAGLVLKANVNPIHLGPIQIKNNSIDVALSTKTEPHFKLQGDVAFLGLRETVIVDIEVPSIVKFEMDSDFGALGKGKLLLEGVGYNTKTGKHQNPDFIIDGSLTNSDFSKWLDTTVKTHVDAVLEEVKKGFDAGLKVLKSAEKKVNGLNSKIEKERAIVRAERNRTLNKLHQAEAKVNSLKGKANSAKSHRHHCHWYQAGCKIKYEAEYLAFSAARDVAEGVLHAIEKAIDVIPVDLDPRVAGIIVEKDTALVALKAAELAVEGVEEIDVLAEKIFNAAVDGIARTKPLVINDLSFKGSLAGSIKHDEPWLLNMDYAIFKQRIVTDFVFKLKDPVYDAKELGYVALQLLDKILDGGLKNIPGSLIDKFREVIGKGMQALSDKNRTEMAKHRKDFQEITKREAELKTAMAQKQVVTDQDLAKRFSSGLDIEPPSANLSNILIEVGHSGQCLTHKSFDVIMTPCKDNDRNQRWTTKKRTKGYVQFENQNLCVKPSTNNPDLGVKLQVDACDPNNAAQSWKVLSQDSDFFRIGNGASQKCLHFTDPSATPGKAKAEWWPCHGADSQQFRVLNNTKPKYFNVNAPIASERTGMCLGTFSSPLRNPFFPRSIAHPVFATQCSVLNQYKGKVPWLQGSFFNYVEDLRGYLKIFDYKGDCLFPSGSKAGDHLVSRPCDHSNDMFWEKIILEDQMQLRNLHTRLCIDIIQNPQNNKQWLAKQLTCSDHSNQALSFGLPKPRAGWTAVSTGKLDTAWKQLPGAAFDVGAGANGDLWVVGTDRKLYEWTGTTWKVSSTSANVIAVAVGPKGTVWHVNTAKQIYSGNGKTWKRWPGAANDITVGADGSVFVVGTDSRPYKLVNNNWQPVGGPGAKTIAADPHGNVISTNTNNQIWARIGTSWRRLPGAGVDVSIGADGTGWVVGTDSRPYRWDGKTWVVMGGSGAKTIAVESSGNVVSSNTKNQIWRATISNSAIAKARPLNVSSNTKASRVNVCRVSGTSGGDTVSWIGKVNGSGQCSVATSGTAISNAAKFEVLSSVVKGNWIRLSGISAPFDAVHAARKGFDVRYACRVNLQGQQYVGWAQDGSCSYVEGAKHATSANFEYLVSESR